MGEDFLGATGRGFTFDVFARFLFVVAMER